MILTFLQSFIFLLVVNEVFLICWCFSCHQRDMEHKYKWPVASLWSLLWFMLYFWLWIIDFHPVYLIWIPTCVFMVFPSSSFLWIWIFACCRYNSAFMLHVMRKENYRFLIWRHWSLQQQLMHSPWKYSSRFSDVLQIWSLYIVSSKRYFFFFISSSYFFFLIYYWSFTVYLTCFLVYYYIWFFFSF